MSTLKEEARHFFEKLQATLIARVESLESHAKFDENSWERPGGGGGLSRLIENGVVFEKGGVNTSAVWGEGFFATGISVVLHPKNPFVPTVHMNLRYLERGGKAWFGGGADLTPFYLFPEDVIHFHTTLKLACDRHHPQYYFRFKKGCDEYFYLPHRQEARGVGGIFFDHLEEDLEKNFAFIQEVGRQFHNAYLPIVNARHGMSTTEKERRWQSIRRARYVEFNLLFDEGTAFGLKTKGRTDSILMSLPPQAAWPGHWQPTDGSREAELMQVLKNPREWVE